MCAANMEFQRVNPTTQVALFAICPESCADAQNITWHIYRGTMNTSTNISQWIRITEMTSYESIWFFGKNFREMRTDSIENSFRC